MTESRYALSSTVRPCGLACAAYMWIFEFFAPVVELTGYSTIFLAAVLGLLGRQFRVLFLILGYAFPTLISIGSVLLDEMTYRRYSHWREVARLLLYCLFEDFPLPANDAVLAVAGYLAPKLCTDSGLI